MAPSSRTGRASCHGLSAGVADTPRCRSANPFPSASGDGRRHGVVVRAGTTEAPQPLAVRTTAPYDADQLPRRPATGAAELPGSARPAESPALPGRRVSRAPGASRATWGRQVGGPAGPAGLPGPPVVSPTTRATGSARPSEPPGPAQASRATRATGVRRARRGNQGQLDHLGQRGPRGCQVGGPPGPTGPAGAGRATGGRTRATGPPGASLATTAPGAPGPWATRTTWATRGHPGHRGRPARPPGSPPSSAARPPPPAPRRPRPLPATLGFGVSQLGPGSFCVASSASSASLVGSRRSARMLPGWHISNRTIVPGDRPGAYRRFS